MTLQENKIVRDSNGNIVVEGTKQKRLINFLIDTPI